MGLLPTLGSSDGIMQSTGIETCPAVLYKPLHSVCFPSDRNIYLPCMSLQQLLGIHVHVNNFMFVRQFDFKHVVR
jgi:hypothetical protein